MYLIVIDNYVVFDMLYIWGDSKLNMINIEFYNTKSGECPVAEFILSLDSKMKAKVLRTKQGNDITRVLYF